jgi:hypothetical protein
MMLQNEIAERLQRILLKHTYVSPDRELHLTKVDVAYTTQKDTCSLRVEFIGATDGFYLQLPGSWMVSRERSPSGELSYEFLVHRQPLVDDLMEAVRNET